MLFSSLLSRLIILVFGNLYPAYASYKAIRNKNIREYLKWMMYWIVFAFFTAIESCTDIFFFWFPFYYELKVLIVVWLATTGSSILYRKFVHPMLTNREHEIDEYLKQAKERGYSAVLQLGSKGVNYATSVVMQTAIKTVQYSLNAANGSDNLRMLTKSQSEGAIYGRSHGKHYMNIVRSNSLDPVDSESSEDVQICELPENGDGDATIVPRKLKAKSNSATAKRPYLS